MLFKQLSGVCISLGFTYTSLRQSGALLRQGVVTWHCSIRRDNLMCFAQIKQQGTKFYSIHDHHSHGIKPCEPLKIKVRRKVILSDFDIVVFY